MSTTAKFVFVFDGEAVRDGSIDIRVFAPAAIAVGKLVEESNRVLNGDDAEVSVRLRANKAGSFESYVEVGVSLYKQAKSVFLGEEAKDAEALVKALGFWGGTITSGGLGLLGLLKYLKGKRPKSATVLEDGRVALEIPGEPEPLIVSKAVAELYSDIKVLQATREIVRPLERDGMEEIRFESPDARHEGDRIERDDVPALVEPAEELEVAEMIHEASSERMLRVLSPSFTGDYVWRLAEGENKISATMKDKDFLSRVEAGDIAFSSGSLLCAEVDATTSQTPTGKISTHYDIVRVHQVIPPPRQTLLRFDAHSDSNSASDQT